MELEKFSYPEALKWLAKKYGIEVEETVDVAENREDENHRDARSEEHTSELQSLRHLVCRLLLEKKNKPPTTALIITSVRRCPASSEAQYVRRPGRFPIFFF